MGNDFDEFGTSIDGDWSLAGYNKNKSITKLTIIDSHNKHMEKKSDKARIISKDEFADYVLSNPLDFKYDNFKNILDKIQIIDRYE